MGADVTDEEKELLRLLTEGDASAFTALYYRYGRKLHAHLLRMVRSEETASEIFQDIFLKIWEQRERIDPGRPFGAYLYRIAENKVYDYFRTLVRKNRLTNELSSTASRYSTETEDTILYEDSFGLLQKAIAQLPPVRRQVYLLCKTEGKSYDEIATLMDISTATINDHMVKANRFLKRMLARYSDTLLLGVWFLV